MVYKDSNDLRTFDADMLKRHATPALRGVTREADTVGCQSGMWLLYTVGSRRSPWFGNVLCNRYTVVCIFDTTS